MRRRIRPDLTTIVVVGDVTPDQARATIAKSLRRLDGERHAARQSIRPRLRATKPRQIAFRPRAACKPTCSSRKRSPLALQRARTIRRCSSRTPRSAAASARCSTTTCARFTATPTRSIPRVARRPQPLDVHGQLRRRSANVQRAAEPDRERSNRDAEETAGSRSPAARESAAARRAPGAQRVLRRRRRSQLLTYSVTDRPLDQDRQLRARRSSAQRPIRCARPWRSGLRPTGSCV